MPAPKVTPRTAASRGDGALRVSFRRGSLMLVPRETGSAPGPVRLVYSDSDQELPVPVGTYTLRNYTIENEYLNEYWALSGSGNKGPEVTIAAGRTERLVVDDRVHFSCRGQVARDGVRVGFGIRGAFQFGLSVFHGPARPPVEYRMMGDDARILTNGIAAYG